MSLVRIQRSPAPPNLTPAALAVDSARAERQTAFLVVLPTTNFLDHRRSNGADDNELAARLNQSCVDLYVIYQIINLKGAVLHIIQSNQLHISMH